MPRFDLPLEELRDYRPEIAVPADFDEFWVRTLAEARNEHEGGQTYQWLKQAAFLAERL